MRNLEQESTILPHVCQHKPTLLDALRQGCCDCFTAKTMISSLRLHHLAHELNDPNTIKATNEELPQPLQSDAADHQPLSSAQK